MADKAISELVLAEQITATDMFVLEQNNTAKKLTGQILENWLVSFADGHGGIQSIVKQSTSGLTDTYRMTLADTTTFDFTVSNGKGISSIAKQSTSGLVDTYKISYNDGTSTAFTVTNGAKGDKGDNTYLWIKYASQKPTASSHSMSDVPDDWIGVYSGNSATAPTDYTQYDWFLYKGDKGDKGDPATIQSQAVAYQVSDSGTIIPSGVWSASVPVVAQGKYLWTRTTVSFNSGNPVVSYSVGRMGLDGSGSVSSVAGISPDSNGNVPLTAGDVGALPSSGGDVTGELKMNGQPISGLNPPTSSTQAANKAYVDSAASKASPHNLLDNSDFRNPVNQRGASSYTLGSWGGYAIDRWTAYIGGCTVTVSDDGIQLNGELYQPISKEAARRYNGKTVTIAAKMGGNVYCAHGVVDQKGAYDVTARVDTPDGVLMLTCEETDRLFFLLDTAASTVVEWAALYEGEYTAETLPEYQPKGYAVELAECQRYYQKKTCQRQIVTYASVGFEAAIDLYAPMRVTPSAKLVTAPPWIRMGGTHTALQDATVNSVTGGTERANVLIAFSTSANLAANEVGYVSVMTIEFSADL